MRGSASSTGVRAGRHRGGFTLMEMLVALAVLGVAVTVFISLFTSSIDISQTASNRGVAASIADARLTDIVAAPERYQWLQEPGAEETRFPIQLTGEDPAAGNPVSPPSAMPPEPRAYETQSALYDRFRWEAFGKLAAGGAYYEVTVVVRYHERGREQLLTMTSAVPALAVPAPEAAPAAPTPSGEAPAA